MGIELSLAREAIFSTGQLKYTVRILSALLFAVATISCSGGDTETKDAGAKKKTSSSFGSDFIIDLPKRTKKEMVKLYMPKGWHSRNWQDYNEAAKKAMKATDYDSAEYLLGESLKLAPDQSVTYYLRGRVKFNSFDQKDNSALEDLKKASELGETDAGLFRILASIYSNSGEKELALETLTKGIEVSEMKCNLLHRRAALYLEIGDKDKAMKDYDEFLNQRKDARVFLMRGQLWESLGEDEKALEDYRRAASARQAHAVLDTKLVAHKFRASILSRKGLHKEAIQELNKALKSGRRNDEVFQLRGDEYMALKKYEKAIEDYTSCIDLEPKFSRLAYEGRSRAYKSIGKEQLSKNDFDIAQKMKKAPAEKPLYQMSR